MNRKISLMIFRFLSIFLIIFRIFPVSYAVSGLLWSKERQDFIQLFSIPQFAVLNEERRLQSRKFETHTFDKEVIKAAYFQEKNLAMFYDNDTKVTGICGDMWTTLSEYLNFTLVPVNDSSRDFGVQLPNGTFTGLMGLLKNNEIQVILRSGFYLFRLGALDYTVPMWKTRYHIYTKPEWSHDNNWLFTIFSRTTWYSIIILFATLSITGCILQRMSDEPKKQKRRASNYNLTDHFFHSFAITCAQGYIPDEFYNRFKILSLSKSIFSWLIILTFSSQLINRMTYRVAQPPFNDLETLFNRTKYILLSFTGSMVHELFKRRVANADKAVETDLTSRVKFINSTREMYRKICYSKKKYAVFEVGDRYQASVRTICPLARIGRSYYETWISSGIRKNFTYKRSIDIAILRFYENGILDILKDRWLDAKLENKKELLFEVINFGQVQFIFMIFGIGALLSLVVFAVEKIYFIYSHKCHELLAKHYK